MTDCKQISLQRGATCKILQQLSALLIHHSFQVDDLSPDIALSSTINPKYDPDIIHKYVQFYRHIIKSPMTVSRSYCHAIGLQIDISCLYRHLIE